MLRPRPSPKPWLPPRRLLTLPTKQLRLPWPRHRRPSKRSWLLWPRSKPSCQLQPLRLGTLKPNFGPLVEKQFGGASPRLFYTPFENNYEPLDDRPRDVRYGS